MNDIVDEFIKEWRKFSLAFVLSIGVSSLYTEFLSDDRYLYQIEVGTVSSRYVPIRSAFGLSDDNEWVSGDALKLKFLIVLDKQIPMIGSEYKNSNDAKFIDKIRPWVSKIQLKEVRQIKSKYVEELFHTFQLRSPEPDLGTSFRDYFFKVDEIVAGEVFREFEKIQATEFIYRQEGLEASCANILKHWGPLRRFSHEELIAMHKGYLFDERIPPSCRLSLEGFWKAYDAVTNWRLRDQLLQDLLIEAKASESGVVVSLVCRTPNCRTDLGKPYDQNFVGFLLVAWFSVAFWILLRVRD